MLLAQAILIGNGTAEYNFPYINQSLTVLYTECEILFGRRCCSFMTEIVKG